MTTYNLGIAWNDANDGDFAQILQQVCAARKVSLFHITIDTLRETFRSLLRRVLAFQILIDRASDTDIRFLPLMQWAQDLGMTVINPYGKTISTCDKVVMHHLLSRSGFNTPLTLILPSYAEQPDLMPVNLASLGERFVIKPSHGRGGVGVVLGANSWDQVLAARQEHPTDKYFLQVQIRTAHFDSHPAWFRVLYCAGSVYPCWWHPATHWYDLVASDDISRYELHPLFEIVTSIASLCGMTMFSSEIALTLDRHFVVVDYVNDQIDLRLQSKAADGVPDTLVWAMAEQLVDMAC